MSWFKKRLPESVTDNERQAEQLKARIISKPHKLEKDAQRLNDLLLADGITLKIFYASGGDRRHG